MVVDFNGFSKGVIGKKLPSDTTLNNMKKSELIKMLHLAQGNYNTLASFYKIATDTSKCNDCPFPNKWTSVEGIVSQLKSVAIERYDNDGGMGGELVVNLNDAIELVKEGGYYDE